MNTLEEKIDFELRKYLAQGYTQFALFPFGEIGKITKRILNEKYSIQEIGIFDNLKAQSIDKIKTLSHLAQNPLKEKEYLLFTTFNPSIYDTLKKETQKYVPENQFLELAPQYCNLDSILYMEHIAEKYVHYCDNNIFYLKRYNVHFYLPYWKTDFIQKYILQNDMYYENDYLFFIKSFCGNKLTESIILDIGANIGNHSLYFALECGCTQILAFEPIKDTFNILCKNISLNHLDHIITPYNFGIGEKHGNARILNYSLENIGGTTLINDPMGNLEIISIDELNIKDPISLIKIDVEYFEVNVLKGAINTLNKYHPYIVVEAWENTENIIEIIKILSPIGYKYIQINQNNYIFFI